MTKVKILNDANEKKKIQFLYGIHFQGIELCKPNHSPSEYDLIDVIKRTGRTEFDIFICHKIDGTRATYLGEFNDGIV